MVSFEPAPERKALRQPARDFTNQHIKPWAAEGDRIAKPDGGVWVINGMKHFISNGGLAAKHGASHWAARRGCGPLFFPGRAG